MFVKHGYSNDDMALNVFVNNPFDVVANSVVNRIINRIGNKHINRTI